MRRSWMVVAMAAVVLGLGCAQNQEQPVTQKQFNRGSETPQETQIVINNGGDGIAIGQGRVATSRPAAITIRQPVVWGTQSQPADGGEEGAALASAVDGASTPTRGGITVYGNYVQNLTWVDSRGMSKSGSLEQTPSTGAVNPAQQGTQKPEAQVTASIPVGIGAMPNVSSTPSAAFKGANTPAAVNNDQQGDRLNALLKAATPQQLDALMKLVDSFFKTPAATSQPG